MDPSTWHFTLSALSQVLAAILGLTSIFIALKVEHIAKEIDYFKRRGASILKRFDAHEYNHLMYQAADILKRLKEFKEKYHNDPVALAHLEDTFRYYDHATSTTPERALRFLDETIYSLEDNLGQKHRVIHAIKDPALIMIAAIFISLELLGLSDFFLQNFEHAVYLLLGVIMLGLVGIATIADRTYQILWSLE